MRIKWAASVFVLLAFLAGTLEAGDDDPFLYIIKDMTVFYDSRTNTLAACDANGDGMTDSSDAIYIFNYRFLDGPPPPAPFPGCDFSEGEDCDSYESCIP